MESETRINVRRLWIGFIYEFSSPEMQRIWVTGHAKIVVSFTECMCGYFDDLNLGDGLDTAIQKGWLSEDEAETTAEFHHLAEVYEPPPGGGDANVLKDPRWAEVVRAAQKAWLGLRKLITDTAERELMEEQERKWGEIPENPS